MSFWNIYKSMRAFTRVHVYILLGDSPAPSFDAAVAQAVAGGWALVRSLRFVFYFWYYFECFFVLRRLLEEAFDRLDQMRGYP